MEGWSQRPEFRPPEPQHGLGGEGARALLASARGQEQAPESVVSALGRVV